MRVIVCADRPALPELRSAGAAGGGWGLPGGPVRGHQPGAIHAKRVTIMPKDIQLARRIRGEALRQSCPDALKKKPKKINKIKLGLLVNPPKTDVHVPWMSWVRNGDIVWMSFDFWVWYAVEGFCWPVLVFVVDVYICWCVVVFDVVLCWWGWHCCYF